MIPPFSGRNQVRFCPDTESYIRSGLACWARFDSGIEVLKDVWLVSRGILGEFR